MNPFHQYGRAVFFGIAFLVAAQLRAQAEPSAAEAPAATAAPSENGDTRQGDFARGGQASAVMGKPLDRADEPKGTAERAPMTSRQIAVWSLVSVASATLITGAVFGLAAGADQKQYDKNSDEELNTQSENKAIVSAVSFGVAGTAAIAAFVLWITDRDGFERKSDSAAKPEVVFSVGMSGASVAIPF